MAKRERKSEKPTMTVSPAEAMLLANALNYVCNAIALPEFATLMGASRKAAEALRRKLLDATDA